MPWDGRSPADEAHQRAVPVRIRCHPRGEKAPFVATAMKGAFIVKTRRLTIDAMLCAMCAVLGYIALDLGNIKITFESIPILLGAMLFGPVDGIIIGGMGTLIYQLIRYGVSATTLLWIAPYVVCGLIAGAWSGLSKFRLSRRRIMLITIMAELTVTVLNTIPIYVDSRLYGYYFPGIVTGVLAWRLGICVVKAAAFGMVLPGIMETVHRVIFVEPSKRRE